MMRDVEKEQLGLVHLMVPFKQPLKNLRSQQYVLSVTCVISRVPSDVIVLGD